MMISAVSKLAQLKRELAAKEAKKNEVLPDAEEKLRKLQEKVIKAQMEFAKARTHHDTLGKSHDRQIEKIKKQMEEEVSTLISLQQGNG